MQSGWPEWLFDNRPNVAGRPTNWRLKNGGVAEVVTRSILNCTDVTRLMTGFTSHVDHVTVVTPLRSKLFSSRRCPSRERKLQDWVRLIRCMLVRRTWESWSVTLLLSNLTRRHPYCTVRPSVYIYPSRTNNAVESFHAAISHRVEVRLSWTSLDSSHREQRATMGATRVVARNLLKGEGKRGGLGTDRRPPAGSTAELQLGSAE